LTAWSCSSASWLYSVKDPIGPLAYGAPQCALVGSSVGYCLATQGALPCPQRLFPLISVQHGIARIEMQKYLNTIREAIVMIKAIMFDYHGVLFTRVKISFREYVTKKYGISHELYNQTFYSNSSLGKKYRNGKLTKNQFLEKMRKKLGLSMKMAKIINDKWERWPVPNKKVFALVRELGKKYPVYMMSGNIRERVRYTEKKYHFKKMFRKCFFSYNLMCSKRQPLFYKKAFRQLPFKPEETVLVDDMKDFTKIAKKAGMRTILFKSTSQTKRDLRKMGISI
jgi:HAD superfamily hydrolase (TIGR01509 family)